MAEKAVQKIEDPVKVEVKDFKEMPTKETSTSLKRGEVLIVELDKDGKEGKTFVTNQHSVDAHFSDEKTFKIKKKG